MPSGYTRGVRLPTAHTHILDHMSLNKKPHNETVSVFPSEMVVTFAFIAALMRAPTIPSSELMVPNGKPDLNGECDPHSHPIQQRHVVFP